MYANGVGVERRAATLTKLELSRTITEVRIKAAKYHRALAVAHGEIYKLQKRVKELEEMLDERR